MHLHHLLAKSGLECLVPAFQCLTHKVIIDGVPHPSRAGNHNGPHASGRKWNVSKETFINKGIESSQTFLVPFCTRGPRFAWNGDGYPMNDDCHVLRQKTKGCGAFAADDGTDFSTSSWDNRLLDPAQSNAVPPELFLYPDIALGFKVECMESPKLDILIFRDDTTGNVKSCRRGRLCAG